MDSAGIGAATLLEQLQLVNDHLQDLHADLPVATTCRVCVRLADSEPQPRTSSAPSASANPA